MTEPTQPYSWVPNSCEVCNNQFIEVTHIGGGVKKGLK